MMGASFDVGIVPRMCEGLFKHITAHTTDEVEFAVEVSFFEIYNEEVFDLLNSTGKPMKVRNHKVRLFSFTVSFSFHLSTFYRATLFHYKVIF